MRFHPFNSVAEALIYVFMFVLVAFIIIGRVNDNNNTQRAREANIQRQEEMQTLLKEVKNISKSNQSYIKCLSLLRFDNPMLGPNSTREEVETALDSCAKAQ